MRTGWRLSIVILGCLVGATAILIVRNPAPLVPAIPSNQVVGTTLPDVVKLHARWCPVCMVTKDVWATVFDEYAGETGTVLVLDGTSKRVRHELHGNRDPAEYRAAIDASLAGTQGDR